MSIVIVGLGPSSGRFLTQEAWQLLANTPEIYLRTAWHPAVVDLPHTIKIISFDDLYETAADFTDVYQQIIAQIIEKGTVGEVVYAVPGHPFVGEATVPIIVQQAYERGISIRIIEGLSFVEPMLTAINLHLLAAGDDHLVDGMSQVQVCDGLELAGQDFPRINVNAPTLIGQVYSQAVAGELKLRLTAAYPDEHRVYLVHSAGAASSQVESIPLYEIDRSASINHLTSLYLPPLQRPGDLTALAEAVATLRGPIGCPWDQEQTPLSMRADLLEEVSELLDAIDLDNSDAICEELGDVLLHIAMQAQMASEVEAFKLTDVIAGIVEKIIRRHPHVWGETLVANSDEVVQNWNAIKALEKRENRQSKSILDNIPNSLPALAQSQKIQTRVRKAGFDWQTIEGVYEKLQEEIIELQNAVTPQEKLMEVGDILFVIVNIAKWLELDAEIALREANIRFSKRFRLVEALAQERGLILEQMSEPDLITLWLEAKAQLATTNMLS